MKYLIEISILVEADTTEEAELKARDFDLQKSLEDPNYKLNHIIEIE